MTQYTAAQKRKLALRLDLFKRAKHHLDTGKGSKADKHRSYNICGAIWNATTGSDEDMDTSCSCRNFINKCLEGRVFFTYWLRSKNIHELSYDNRYVQRCRHALLDAIIKAHEEAIK